MIDTTTIRVGCIVWSIGRNDFGDGRLGGMVVIPSSVDPETGERLPVTILTDSPAKPRQDSLLLHRGKGGYDSLGLVARLHRLPVADIDPHATDGFRGYGKVWRYAIAALRAASLPPNDHIGTKGHDALISAYRVLRAEAEMLKRGAA